MAQNTSIQQPAMQAQGSTQKENKGRVAARAHPAAQDGGVHAGVVPVAQLLGVHHGHHQVRARHQVQDGVERLRQYLLHNTPALLHILHYCTRLVLQEPCKHANG